MKTTKGGSRVYAGKARRSPRQAVPILDMHAHFPMQLPPPQRPCDNEAQTKRNQFLMDAANRFSNFENPLEPAPDPRYTLDRAKKAGVNFASVLYQPADELFGPCEPFSNLRRQISVVNEKLVRGRVKLAKNPRDLKTFITNGDPVAFHCLEGGFSVESPARVATLADEGLAYIILAHLVFREVSASVNAFPFMSDTEYDRMFAMPVPGLTQFGMDVCKEMCRVGIIPDVTHATEQAIEQVLAIADANNPKRPVIVSHGAPRGKTGKEYKLNLSEKTIEAIRDREGVIGVIFYDHWLLPVDAPAGTETSVQHVIAAIKRIREVAGSTKCIAIGSDLDGFIEPVKGLENVSKMRNLEKALVDAGFSDDDVRGILFENALKTLSKGWARTIGTR
jgi:microsomal dipeptidase-like Zn-dependent dipeptidase